MKSTLGTLNKRDFFKGLVLAVGTPVLILLQQLIPTWTPWLASHLGGNTGAVILQAALSAAVTYLLKNLATDDTKEAAKTIQKAGGTVLPIILFFVASAFSMSVSAQSPFKHMPRPERAMSLSPAGVSANEITAYRFSAPTAMFLYPQRQIGTSLGFGYNRMHWVDATQNYYTDFAVNMSIIAAGNTTPSPTNVMSIGVFVSLLNQLIQLGPIYNLPSGGTPKGSFGVGVAIGVPLN